MRKGENIYKRKDGRWEGRYIKGRKKNGMIHYGYIYAKSYQKVKEELLLQKAIHSQHYTQQKPTYSGTVAQWCRYWLTQVKKRVKVSTFINYQIKLKHHVLPVLGDLFLTELKKKDLEDWIEGLKSTLKASTIRTIFQIVKTCIGDALHSGLLFNNPCIGVILPKGEERSIQALRKKDHAKLYKQALKDPSGLAVILALDSGLRIGEIAALKWEDIDFSANVLQINRTAQRLPLLERKSGKRTHILESTPKSSSSKRVVPLSETVVRLLKQKKKATIGPYVVKGSTASDPRMISYTLKKICLACSLPPVPFHALRHSFATRCIEKGVTIATISSLLGHHSVKMTLDTYITSFLIEKRKAIRLISSLF